MHAVTTPHWWMLRPTDQSARQPHRHGRAEAVPKLLQVGAAERAATLCDLPFQISTSCFPSAPCFRSAVTTPRSLQVFNLFRCPLPVAMLAATTPPWWMLRPTHQSARQPHRHERAEAVPKLLQVGTAERAATLCDLPFQISTSCFPSAPRFRSAVTTPQRCKSSAFSVARCPLPCLL